MSWFFRLDKTGKALAALSTAFAGGATFILTMLVMGFVQPPGVEENAVSISQNNSRIQENTVSIQDMDDRLLRISKQGEHIICLLTLPEGTTPIEAARDCPKNGRDQ